MAKAIADNSRSFGEETRPLEKPIPRTNANESAANNKSTGREDLSEPARSSELYSRFPFLIGIGRDANRAGRQTAPASEASHVSSVVTFNPSPWSLSHSAGGPSILETLTEISFVPTLRNSETSNSVTSFHVLAVAIGALRGRPLIRPENCLKPQTASVALETVFSSLKERWNSVKSSTSGRMLACGVPGYTIHGAPGRAGRKLIAGLRAHDHQNAAKKSMRAAAKPKTLQNLLMFRCGTVGGMR